MEISVSWKTEHMLTDLHMSNTIKVTCMLALTICSLKTENKARHDPFTSEDYDESRPILCGLLVLPDAPDYNDTHSFFGLVTKQICSPMNATDSARAVTKLYILNSKSQNAHNHVFIISATLNSIKRNCPRFGVSRTHLFAHLPQYLI